MRTRRQLVQDLIKHLTDTLTRDCDPGFPGYVIPNDQGTIDDGGQYGDPLARTRPDFLQAVYDDMPGMVPGERDT